MTTGTRTTVADKRQARVADAVGDIQTGMYKIQELREDLETVRDNLQEHFEGTARYEHVEELCYELEDLENELESAITQAEALNLGL